MNKGAFISTQTPITTNIIFNYFMQKHIQIIQCEINIVPIQYRYYCFVLAHSCCCSLLL